MCYEHICARFCMVLDDSDSHFSLTIPQKEIWFDQMLSPDSVIYNVSGYCRFDHLLVPELLEQAIIQTIQEIDALRLRFFSDRDGYPFQYFSDDASSQFLLVDLRETENPERALVSFLSETQRIAFELVHSPLYRFRLVRLPNDCSVFVFIYHHLIIDGWSGSIVNNRIADNYTQLLNGEKLFLSFPSYSEFILEDEKYFGSEKYESQRDYWKTKVQRIPALPFKQRYRLIEDSLPFAGHHSVRINRAVWSQLEEKASTVKAGLFPAFLASLYAHLHLFEKSEGCIIGYPTLNRAGKFKQIPGLFTTVCAGFFDYGIELSFLELVKLIADELKENYRHTRFPLREVFRTAGVANSPDGRRFDLTVSFEKHAHLYRFGDISVRGFAISGLPQRNPLNIHVRDYDPDDDVLMDITFHQAYFDDDTIREYANRLSWLFEKFIESPEEPLSSYDLILEADEKCIREWNKPSFDVPTDISVVDLFEQQVELRGNQEALVVGDHSLSYRTLNSLANKVANFLVSEGIKPEAIIGVCLDRDVDLYVVIWGILKAGAAYLPIDPNTPDERISDIITDAGCSMLISSEAFRKRIHLEKIPSIDPKLIQQRISGLPDTNPPRWFCQQNLAYVIYTSGSSGKPKGVMIEHRSFVNAILSYLKSWDPQPGERVLQQASISFDVSVCELFPFLCSGGTVVVADKDTLLEPAKFVDFVQDHLINFMGATPSLLNNLQEVSASLPSVRSIFSGGESLKLEDVRNFLANSRVVNGYGPTEATIGATAHVLGPEDSKRIRIPIGRALPNYEIYILDEKLRLLPPGVMGEICISGPTLARGYLNREVLTAEKFVQCVILGTPKRLYRSGDLGIWRSDGSIEFMGRMDSQVKLRGYRIELGEIESAIRSISNVKEVLVVLNAAGTAQARLIAYYTLFSSECEEHPETFASRLQQKLPTYMLPSQWVELDCFPLTTSGKIDHRALPVPELENRENVVLPETPTELKLTEIWSQVLGVEIESVLSNFFDCGGHSLLSTQVISRVRDTFGVELSFQDFFEHPVLKNQALWIDSRSVEVCYATAAIIQKSERIEPSLAQQRLLFLSQLDQNKTLYDMFACIRLSGELDADAFTKSLLKVVELHDSLRSAFPPSNDGPTLVILEPFNPLESIDISELPSHEKEERLNAICREQRDLSLDLEKGPLIRFVKIRLQTDLHVLCVKMHHTIGDGWSTNLFFSEWGRFYKTCREGFDPVDVKSEIQYSDYALWQKEWLASENFDIQLSYWKKELEGLPDRISLPTDFPHPQQLRYRGGHFRSQLDPQLTGLIKSVAKAHQVTEFMALLAAFNVLLARYSGQDDIIVGSPIANRNHSQTEKIIGLFVNTLVFRTRFSPQDTFETILDRTRKTTLGAYAHQDLPFESLVEAINPVRSMSHAPIFQVLFVYQTPTNTAAVFDGLSGEFLDPGYEVAKFDLTLSVFEHEGTFICDWEYDTDLYLRETIERMSVHFRILLEALFESPSRSVFTHQILSAFEQERFRQWNQTSMPVPEGITCLDLWDEQVAQIPEKTAIRFDTRKISYAEVDRKANAIAQLLKGIGVDRDNCVAVFMDRSPEAVISILGVLKAGAAFLPIDASTPAERVTFILEDSQAKALLTDSSPDRFGQSFGIQNILVGPVETLDESLSPPISEVDPKALAYLIYTSGSTGNPKGVLIEHLGLLNMVLGYQKRYAPGRADCSLQQASLAFDVGVAEVFTSLCSGATLVMARKDDILDPLEFYEFLKNNRVTLFGATPTLLGQLNLKKGSLPDARIIFSGGEAATWKTIGSLVDVAQVENGYGPTEASVSATVHTIMPEDQHRDTLPIGKPLPNYRVYILDPHFYPVPIGVPGELSIAGIGLARGYLNNESLTDQKFVEIEILGEKERVYRTGDLARWLPDGNIEFIGRIDRQVKIRGYRIELGEVENAISSISFVKDTVVVVHSFAGSKHLVAYVTLHSEKENSEHLIKQELERILPNYMVPSVVEVVNEFILTSNGKIDRKQLPQPNFDAQGFESVVASDELELMLCDIWSAVLNRKVVAVNQSFFEIGGHSLLATQLASRIRDKFKIDFPLRLIFEHTDIKSQAAWIRTHRSNTRNLRIAKHSEGNLRELSYAQQRLWFVEQLGEKSPAYNICCFLQLRGELNIPALSQSLRWVVERHESLRGQFILQEGKPVIKIRDPWDPLIVCPGIRRDSLEPLMYGYSAEVMDLENDKLFHSRLLPIDDSDSHILFVKMHHIVSDGWSLEILMREISLGYNACLSGSIPELEPLSIQYGDYAVSQKEWLAGEFLESQLDYWDQQLRGGPELLELPTDFPRPPVFSGRGSFVSLDFGQEVYSKLKEISMENGTTPFMTLLAAFQVLLSHYSKSEDVVVGSPIANRHHQETEPIIGFFINNLILRNFVRPNETFSDLLKQVRRKTLDAYSYQDVPFEMIVERLNPKRNLSHTPLFQVVFTFRNVSEQILSLDGVETEPVLFGSDDISVKIDLMLEVVENNGKLRCNWAYCADLFTRESMECMARYYENLLNHLLEYPGNLLSDSFVLPKEDQKLLTLWNNTNRDDFSKDRVEILIRKQAILRPDHIAIEFGLNKCSYFEFETRSNQVASFLLGLGVQNEMPVMVSLSTSIDYPIVIVGILKAGGAFVPIDPDTPETRMRLMIKDSGAPFLITDKAIQFESGEPVVKVISLDEMWKKSDNFYKSIPDHQSESHSLAYIIYTSGSTGTPKGVLIEHQSFSNLVHAINVEFRISEKDRYLQQASHAFDFSVFNIFNALCNGATLVLIEKDAILDARKFVDFLQEKRITIFGATPSHYSNLELSPRKMPSLRLILCAGEAFSFGNSASILGPVQIFNGYGPTEVTICASLYEVTMEDSARKVPIGKPISNYRIHILNDDLKILPIGVPGELCIEGVGVGRGYINRHELTDEKFVEIEIFGKTRRIYRTGDLARWLPDGNIEFVGRNDTQVKLRGYRIELGEIENVIKSLPEVRESVVVVQSLAGNDHLVGYVSLSVDVDDISQIIKQRLAERLPKYMVPTIIEVVSRFPLTTSGKIDRNNLPVVSREGSGYDSLDDADEVELLLGDLWSSLLKVTITSFTHDFFEAGGHSLLVTQLASRIRETFKVEFPLRLLFELPTIRQQAEWLKENRYDAQFSEIFSIEGRDLQEPSYSQQRLWFIEQLGGTSPAYNVCSFLRLNGKLDLDAFGKTVSWLSERHETLRSQFICVQGKPMIRIRSDSYVMSVEDETTEETLVHLMRDYAALPLNLERDPLFQVRLVPIADSMDHALFIKMHHVITDGWSLEILMREISLCYNALLKGNYPDVKPLGIQYGDYASAQKSWLEGEQLQKQLDYWDQKLKGVPELLELPLDFPRPPVMSNRGSFFSIEVDSLLVSKIRSLSLEYGATQFMTLLAAFNVLMSRYSNTRDIVVGSPIANRTHHQTESLIGFFVNNLALRNYVNPDDSFVDLLSQVRRTTLDAYTYQETPFEVIIEKINPKRNLSHSPLCQVAFAFRHINNELPEFEGIEATQLFYSTDDVPVKIDLMLEAVEVDGKLHCGWAYCADLFSRKSMENMARYYVSLLEFLTGHPFAKLSQSYVLASEDRELLYRWNDTSDHSFPDDTVDQLIFKQSQQFPDHIALEFNSEKMSYSDFEAKSNQIAQYLRSIGIGRESPVMVCMNASLEYPVIILGILKAGGAFVPLDPDIPESRLRFAIEDSQAVLCIYDRNILPGTGSESLGYVLVGDLWREIANYPTAVVEKKHDRNSLAYIIYTSGSTGVPKGVLIEHKGLANLVHGKNQSFHVTCEDRWLQQASYAFDFSVMNIFIALCHGATLFSVEKNTLLDPRKFVGELAKSRISVFGATPSLFGNLELSADQLPDLRLIICGGEVFTLGKHASLLGKVQIFNAYGPTEVTVCATMHEVTPEDAHRKVSIGKPISNYRVHILSDDLRMLPIGVPGELCVEGIGLARGYLKRPELTREKFVEAEIFGEQCRVYRTGDLARWLPDGQLEFMGRLDNQVKFRGYRFELGEIESRLLANETIKACAVELVRNGKLDLLVAFVVLSQAAAEVDSASIKQQLQTELPEYMIPSRFVVLEQLPVGHTGKIDRKALQATEVLASDPVKTSFNDLSLTQKKLEQIWGSILGIESVSREDNFFDLGGHSLLVPKLLAEIHRVFDVPLTIRDLFQSSTLEAQSRLLEQPDRSLLPPVDSMDFEDEVVLESNITPENRISEHLISAPEKVLLTGSTGFLGVWLLHELLIQTEAKIFCLIRGNGDLKRRIEESMMGRGLWEERFENRITPISGDISLPGLGLEKSIFDQLSVDLDAIYHNAAWVNHTYPYTALKPVNVDSTVELLKLACRNRAKAFHFVSTFSELSLLEESGQPNTELMEHLKNSPHGYAQSKWVAEQLVKTAGRRGLFAKIYRPRRISGDSRFGQFNTDDFVSLLMKGCAQMCAYPEIGDHISENLAPVDFVARTIVSLSLNPSPDEAVYDLLNLQEVTWNQLFSKLSESVPSVSRIDYFHWRERLSQDTENALFPFLAVFPEERVDETELIAKKLINQKLYDRTMSTLPSSHGDCNSIDEKLLQIYFEQFQTTNFLPNIE